MTNAVGYNFNEREERTSKKWISYDINRDFPYNQRISNNKYECLNTIAARAVYKIVTQNSIQALLTFHGGANVIGYPWGSMNRSYKKGVAYKGYTAPDYYSLSGVGKAL